MDVKNVEKSDNGRLRFQVEIESDVFENEVNKAYLKAKKNIFVPGFRKGKAPRKIVEGMYGAEVFYDDAVSALAEDAFRNGLKETGERTVGRPRMEDYDVGEGKRLTISYSAALFPVPELGQYKGLEIYKQSAKATDTEIEAELKRVQKRNERIETVDRPAENGDTVNIDYDGYRDGVRFDGGKDEGHDLVLGSGSFVPGFEEQLIGMEAGQEKEIDITFPENYHADLAGAAVVFKVKVNEVKHSELPELDDEFAKDVSEWDTLEEFKNELRENIEKEKQETADRMFRNDVLAKAVGNMTVTVPPEMLEENLGYVMDEYARSVRMQGMSFEQYMDIMGMTEQSFRAMMRPTAENRAKTEILLDAVAAAEGLEVSPEEIEKEYEDAAKDYGMDTDKVKGLIDEDAVTRDIMLRKAGDFICDNAVPTDVKPEEPDSESPAKEEKTEEAGEEAPEKADE